MTPAEFAVIVPSPVHPHDITSRNGASLERRDFIPIRMNFP